MYKIRLKVKWTEIKIFFLFFAHGFKHIPKFQSSWTLHRGDIASWNILF